MYFSVTSIRLIHCLYFCVFGRLVIFPDLGEVALCGKGPTWPSSILPSNHQSYMFNGYPLCGLHRSVSCAWLTAVAVLLVCVVGLVPMIARSCLMRRLPAAGGWGWVVSGAGSWLGWLYGLQSWYCPAGGWSWILTWLAQRLKVSWSWCWPAVGRTRALGVQGGARLLVGGPGLYTNCCGWLWWFWGLVAGVGAQKDMGLVLAHCWVEWGPGVFCCGAWSFCS